MTFIGEPKLSQLIFKEVVPALGRKNLQCQVLGDYGSDGGSSTRVSEPKPGYLAGAVTLARLHLEYLFNHSRKHKI